MHSSYYIVFALLMHYSCAFTGTTGTSTSILNKKPGVLSSKALRMNVLPPRTVPLAINMIAVASTAKFSIASMHRNPWYVWTILAMASTAGLASESTKIGAALSSPLVTMFITLIFCNTNVLPASSHIYSIVLEYLVPLAVPLLLLDADLRKVIKSSEQLLRAFIIGSIGTCIGTIAAYKLFPMRGVAGASKIAAALCARHIGGAVNFVAVSDVLLVPPELIAAAIAADNVVIAIYFSFLFAITPSAAIDEPSVASLFPRRKGTTIDAQSLASALSLSFFINLFAQLLKLRYGLSPIISTSATAVALATLLPKQMQSLSQAGGCIGVLFMQLFFAVTGAMGHIPSVLKVAPQVFLHTTMQIVVHFLFSVGVGRVLNIPLRETVLASNANVGGPTTAAAMATSKNWKSLVLPALLTGVFGYSIATGVGLLMHRFLLT